MSIMRPEPQCCVVAVIGFDGSIPVRGKGILERHGLALVQYSSLYRGLSALQQSVQVDAIILDASRRIEEDDEEWIADVLAVAASPPWRDTPLPIVVVTSCRMPVTLRHRCRDLGAHVLSRDRFRYQRIGRLLRTFCTIRGLPSN
jgi:hypothetical protein